MSKIQKETVQDSARFMVCYHATLPLLLPANTWDDSEGSGFHRISHDLLPRNITTVVTSKDRGSTLKGNAFLRNRALSCDRPYFHTLLFFGAVPSLILLDFCERLSAG
jgi:hypothetical protein